jgi:hypothetical protein
MVMVRRIGALLLAVAAVLVYFMLKPAKVQIASPSGSRSQLLSIDSDFSSNNGQAQYIYQQIYATGVATKDTLALLVTQADQRAANAAATAQTLANHADQRIPAELLILALGVGLFLATTERRLAPPAPAPPAEPPGDGTPATP